MHALRSRVRSLTPHFTLRTPHSLCMRASDFDYQLPPSLIAQEPLPDRAASRLLVLERATGAIRHARFADIEDLVAPEDALVLNVSRVIPARLHGRRDTGAAAELLLVRELPDGTWLAL